MDCKDQKDHLWEYRWASEYRRCKRDGCQRSEWRAGNAWILGPRCNVENYHELSKRANGGTKSRPYAARRPGEASGYTAADLRERQKEAEQHFFLKQKERMKNL